ncbi:DUF5711 family protein [Anaerotignum sp.]|uniref:DUF5711 family protein n=1 Tax=Anaerotignum sp. TaxID=2039241 RepID=UPI00331850DB
MQKDSEQCKEKDKGLITLLVVLTVVGAAAGFIFMDTFYGGGKVQGYFSTVFQKEGDGSENGSSVVAQGKMAIDESSRSTFVTLGQSFLLCTKDGVKFFNEMGDRKWNDTFNMTTPQLIHEGEFAAVGDMSGKTVRVYDEDGLLYTVQTDGELMQFALNVNGYLSIVSKESNAYRIQIYNPSGTLLKGRVEESHGVFPLSSDVSDDNKAFVVSYMDTTDVEPIGRVLFFYINPNDSENYTDSMFAAVEKSGEIIPIIGFMQGGVLVAVSDKAVYGVSSGGQEVWNYPLDNMVKQVSLSNKNYVVLGLGEGIANRDGRAEGSVCWIDKSGRESAFYEGEGDIKYLNASEQGVVIGVDKIYFGLRHTGKMAWSYRATADVRDILPMERLETVMLVSKNEAVITDMKGFQKVRPILVEETTNKHEVVGGTDNGKENILGGNTLSNQAEQENGTEENQEQPHVAE